MGGCSVQAARVVSRLTTRIRSRGVRRWRYHGSTRPWAPSPCLHTQRPAREYRRRGCSLASAGFALVWPCVGVVHERGGTWCTMVCTATPRPGTLSMTARRHNGDAPQLRCSLIRYQWLRQKRIYPSLAAMTAPTAKRQRVRADDAASSGRRTGGHADQSKQLPTDAPPCTALTWTAALSRVGRQQTGGSQCSGWRGDLGASHVQPPHPQTHPQLLTSLRRCVHDSVQERPGPALQSVAPGSCLG